MQFKNRVFPYCVACLMTVAPAAFTIASEGHHLSKACILSMDEGKLKAGDTFSIGAQLRVRGDFVKNQNLGDFSFSPDTHDEQVVSRTRLNLSARPNDSIGIFAQAQFYSRNNHNDYSKANLYQMFIELAETVVVPFNLRIGRQDFCYGSAFFLGPNDFYEGLAWDGVRLRLAPHDKVWIDLIGARYVNLNKNTSDWKPALYGAYASYGWAEETDIDLYYFYHKGGFKFFHTDLADSPHWSTLGVRLSGKIKERFDYEVEPLYQFGRIDNPERGGRDRISAFGGHIEAGYTVDSKYKPRLFSAYAFGSGDNDTGDKKYKEFHGNIYNDNYLVGDTSIVADLSGVTAGSLRASGMHILIGGLSLDLHPKLNLNLDYHYFLANKAAQGVSKNIGSEANLIFTYKPFHDINIIASANRFFTGRFFKDAAGTGRDVNYFYLQAQFEF